MLSIVLYVLAVIYLVGVGVFVKDLVDGMYIGIDRRPLWLAALHIFLWPIFVVANFLTEL